MCIVYLEITFVCLNTLCPSVAAHSRAKSRIKIDRNYRWWFYNVAQGAIIPGTNRQYSYNVAQIFYNLGQGSIISPVDFTDGIHACSCTTACETCGFRQTCSSEYRLRDTRVRHVRKNV